MRTFDEINADITRAMDFYDAKLLFQLADELEGSDSDDARGVIHRARGAATFYKGEYDRSLEFFNLAMEEFESKRDRAGIAAVTGNIGALYMMIGDVALAFEHFDKALSIHEELRDEVGVAGVTGNIGAVYCITGDYAKALEHYLRALTLHEQLDDQAGVVDTLINLGAMYYSSSDDDRALEYSNKALELSEKLNNVSAKASSLANIGLVYQHKDDPSTALEFFRRSMILEEELGSEGAIARIKGFMLESIIETEANEDAAVLLKEMDVMQIDEPDVVIHRETRRARIYELEKNYTAAISTLNRSLELSQKHNFRSFESDIHKQLRDLCQKTDDFAGYIANNEAHDKIVSEIRGSETSRHLVMQEKEREIEFERREHEKQRAVLHSTLPQHIAERVVRGEVVNDTFDKAAVIFVDIVDFTTISDGVPPGQVVNLLEQIFTTFDAVCEKHNIVKIKTIGDSYLAVCFADSELRTENSELRAANAALDMLASLRSLTITMPPELGDTSWTKDLGNIQVRIGMHSGPVTAGVIGTQRMQYDVWGDTVNVASRMESSGEAGKIHVSEHFASAIHNSSFAIHERGTREVKGKGKMKTFWLKPLMDD